jgi:hypothetical protein
MGYIKYTIQPTDSIRLISERFGVSLNDLVELNPQVKTPEKQEGIEIKLLISDHPCLKFLGQLKAFYGNDASKVFSMLYAIAKVNGKLDMTIEEIMDQSSMMWGEKYRPAAFDLLGILKHPDYMYYEYAKKHNISVETMKLPDYIKAEIEGIEHEYNFIIIQTKTI